MIDCEDFGEMVIYTKTGDQRTIDHKTTVKLCRQAQEEGVGIEEIIKRDLEPALKMIKFRN
ncbi:MAG: hypothetical protein M1464_02815 [Candidatus Thermoplasmatota archaeon]|nr:hypothetical protein [Candidatus Thermoplasmatota archaeon]